MSINGYVFLDAKKKSQTKNSFCLTFFMNSLSNLKPFKLTKTTLFHNLY